MTYHYSFCAPKFLCSFLHSLVSHPLDDIEFSANRNPHFNHSKPNDRCDVDVFHHNLRVQGTLQNGADGITGHSRWPCSSIRGGQISKPHMHSILRTQRKQRRRIRPRKFRLHTRNSRPLCSILRMLPIFRDSRPCQSIRLFIQFSIQTTCTTTILGSFFSIK